MRYIIIHLDRADVREAKGHAFGPFASVEEAATFEALGRADSCFKTAVPIVGPEAQDVLDVLAEEPDEYQRLLQ